MDVLLTTPAGVDLFRDIVKRPGEWVNLNDLKEGVLDAGDVCAAFDLTREYDGVNLCAVDGHIWLCFDLDDDLTLPPSTSLSEEGIDLIVSALLSSSEWPPFDLLSIANRSTRSTWLHILSEKGLCDFIKRYLSSNPTVDVFRPDANGKIPLDLALDRDTYVYLQQYGQIIIQDRQEKCRAQMKSLWEGLEELKRELIELDAIRKMHRAWWIPSWLQWFF